MVGEEGGWLRVKRILFGRKSGRNKYMENTLSFHIFYRYSIASE